MSVTHSFSVELARQAGVEGAILLNYFGYWHQRNETAGNNLHRGRYWTYNTIKALVAQFPYWTAKQMRTLLLSLEKRGYILTDHLGGNDRTTWYALTDAGMILLGLTEINTQPFAQTDNSNLPNRKMQLPKQENAVAQTGNSNLPNRQMLYNDTITNTVTVPFTNTNNCAVDNFSVLPNELITVMPAGSPDLNAQRGSPAPTLQSCAKVSPHLPKPLPDDWPGRLRAERLFLEGCRKNLKLTDAPLLTMLAEFDTEQTALGKTHPTYKDYKSHAYHWLRIQTEKQQRHGSTTRKSVDTGPAGPGAVIRREYKQQSFRRSGGISGSGNDE